MILGSVQSISTSVTRESAEDEAWDNHSLSQHPIWRRSGGGIPERKNVAPRDTVAVLVRVNIVSQKLRFYLDTVSLDSMNA
jgi:hypothetical protein